MKTEQLYVFGVLSQLWYVRVPWLRLKADTVPSAKLTGEGLVAFLYLL